MEVFLQLFFFYITYLIYIFALPGLLAAIIYKEYEFYRLTRPNNHVLDRIRKRIYLDDATEGRFGAWKNFKMWLQTGWPGKPHYLLKNLEEVSE